NLYGPTEAAIDVTAWDCSGLETPDSTPIGKPVANTRIYLLDAYQQPVPLGVAGEIYIGGVQVARGYLNLAQLTAERFIKDPFCDDPSARLYRTGDLGCWLADGNIEYLGRNDFQVKIRGFRIELGEIEDRLSRHPGVQQAVVMVREDIPGDKRLVAYFTANTGVSLDVLRDYLLAQLPDYMVPTAYVPLEKLPLTPNGKLDRNALHAPDQSSVVSRDYQAPQGAKERAIAEIWQDLLDLDQVGRHDHFFELGGHSLLAVKLIERMRQIGLSADVRVLFSQPTLAALAAAVGGGTEVVVAANLIPEDCEHITPDMLPLVGLTQDAIDRIVARVPGGAANVQDIYALAPLQEGILYHHLSAERGDPYVLKSVFAFQDQARLDAFSQALQQLIQRHDILRTSLFWEGLDESVQVVWRQASLGMETLDLDPALGDISTQLQDQYDPRHYRLELGQAPLMRLVSAYDAPQKRIVSLLLCHHLVLDHTALDVMRDEVQALMRGKGHELPASVPYRNYVAQARLGVSVEAHEAFFRDLLGDIDEPTLPFDLHDVQGDGSEIEETHYRIDRALSQRLRTQARQAGVSAASLVHLAWAQVLGKVTGKDTVVFGTVLMGRMSGSAGTDRALGMFINTLPMRIDVGHQGAQVSVKATHAQLSALLKHEHASLALAQRCSGVPGDLPLFSALLNYRHSGGETLSPEASATWAGIQPLGTEERSNYPLALNVDDQGKDFVLNAQTVINIGAQRICDYMQAALQSLVEALEHAPQAPLHSLSILPEQERTQLIVDFNATSLDYPVEQTIHGLFEVQVELTPEAVAVVHGDVRLSYRELNNRANQLAHHLRDIGVKPDSRVAICVERSEAMVIGLLAILKAGGGYVPLDPAYPADRITYMLQDSAPTAVLAQRTTLGLLTDVSVPLINLHDTALQAQSVQNPHVPDLTPAHLAYVIYTSGSTGLPKGVMIEHRNTVNFLTWAHQSFDSTVLAKTLFSTSLNFDLAVYECFAPLTSGGSIDVVTDVLELRQGNHDVTLINTVPSALKALLESGGLRESVHTVNVAGEALKRSLVESLFEQTSVKRLCNLYGPSETTTYSSWVAMDREQGFAAHIGKPVGNTQFYLLDAQMQPVPLGVPGEIHIGGAGVARGYLNRDDLTAERFLSDPFSKDPNARMYKTGDLGRWLADGNIEYLGRNDDQVKIRGFRIELGEIEACLARHEAVKETVVMVREDVFGDKRLAAYFTADSELNLDVLREYLLGQLPDYMVPTAYVQLEKLPLTPNGKLDRKALPAPDQSSVISHGYEAPIGTIEIAIADIWQDLLGLDQVGRHDHFFELGGHSLLAVKLIEHMRQIGLSADVRVLFSQPTLAALAAAVCGDTEVIVPANLIPEDCEHITPDMLPLVDLTQDAIDRIVARVPGGAANVQDIYALAPLQEGILYHHLSAERGDPYVLKSVFAFQDQARLDAFLQALQQLIQRHDILRTSLLWEGLSEPVQVVWRQASLSMETLDLDPAQGDISTQLQHQYDPRHYRLELGQAPLMRLVSAYDAPQKRIVSLLLCHHLVLDHTALDVMRAEIQLLMLGEGHELPASVPYRNYVAQARLGVSVEAHEAFFRDMLGDIDEPILPFNLHDVQGDGSEIEEAYHRIDSALSQRLRTQARQCGVSAATLVHLAWAKVLGKATGKDTVVFGTVLMGRMSGSAGTDRALGVFINTLPMRIDMGHQGAQASVQATHAQLSALLEHEHASLALAQRCSRVQGDMPLFSALLNYRHSGGETLSPEASAAWAGIQSLSAEERSNYPLALNVDDLGGDFTLNAQTVVDIGAQRICDYMQAALQSLVEALEHAPQAPLYNLSILPEQERHQLMVEFNATEHPYPHDELIHTRFEQQAEDRPDACAVSDDSDDSGKALTYAELNREANQLAHQLIKLGIGPDDRVAICVERGSQMIIGLLATLKAGAGYVPLDPAYPAERLAYLLQDSAPAAVLVHTETADILPLDSLPVINLDSAALQAQSVQNPHVQGLTPAHLAYVIYTSGSTGLPKGVQVEHRNVVNLVQWGSLLCPATQHGALLHKTSISFDASVWEIFWPLCSGMPLVLARPDGQHDPVYLARLIRERQVSVVQFVPVLLQQFLDLPDSSQCLSLTDIVCGGGELTVALAEQVRQRLPWARLHNVYGPTETTVDCSSWTLEPHMPVPAATLPIGRPISNTRLYVLDAHDQPVPRGVIGQLHIGGAGVTRGYLNLPQQHAERFIDSPFVDGDRLYRSGDLVRCLADGNIEYLGRNDDQVKIRGFRIELGEIEALLARHEAVKETVIMAREDVPGDKRLVAYYTSRVSDETLDIETLRTHLQAQLPDYMVPAAYVRLDSLPLTPNGKLDRKALPAPDLSSVISREYQAPQGDTERAIARIWQDLLRIDQVGRHDHFFELGGHSLLAVKLIERMRQIDLSADVRVLFSQPTLAALAAAVGGGTEVIVPTNLIPEHCEHIIPDMLTLVDLNQTSIDQIVARVPGGVANVQDIYPLAPLQEGILYHHLMAPQDDPYRRNVLFNFDSQERVQQFAAALQTVITRHDILRTSVRWEDLDEPVQVVWRHAELSVEEIRLDPEAADLTAQLQEALDPLHHPLDIRQAPMMRIAYAHDPVNDRWAALLVFHHLINDATSLPVLAHEIEACMQGQEHLLPASVPYRNYVAQARLGVSLEAHEAFFRDLLGDIDEPTLPFDLHDVQGDGSELEEVRQQLEPELADRLRHQAQSLDVSVASLYHLAWAQVLGKVTGKDEVVFGTVLMGRMLGGDGADRSLGMFINTLPLRVELGNQGVRNGVKQTHARLTELLGHEHASLVLAQRCSGVQAPTPLFSALLNYRHIDAPSSNAEGLGIWIDIERLKGTESTNYPLALNVDDQGQGFALTLTCPIDIGAERIAGYVQTALESLVNALEDAPSSAISTLPILPCAERQQLLVSFNATQRSYPQDKTVHDLFETQAEAQPDAVAAIHNAQALTYRELNQRANRLAHRLIGLGVQPGERVAMLLERSLDLVISQLAILKCAAVYVPLDINAPVERQHFMIQDSQAAIVLSHSNEADVPGARRVDLDSLALDGHDNNPHLPQSGEAIAYIMYTSGSTGTPKGVLVPHRAINRLVINNGYADFNAQDRVAFASNPAFDASTLDVWAPLLNGGCVVVVEQDVLLSQDKFRNLLREQAVSVLWMTAGLFHQYADGLTDVLQQLRYLIVGGDVLDPAVIGRVLKSSAPQHLLNGYGPTEATTFTTTFEITSVSEGSRIPIGRPVGNTRAYVLDQHQQPVAVGVAGELYIGGDGVAKGYLNQPELTAEKFIADPFSDNKDARLYRTGDLVRWSADGSLEYLGRNDDQVKIRGFRIELGEIEAKLAAHGAVHDAVVMAREDVPGDKRLVAYFTADAEVSLDVLREHLRDQLPDYMVPAAYVRLESLPLTPNGKLDRKALPAPDQLALVSREHEAPRGATEQVIADIWQDLLGIDQVGRHDHFFELGGHSLLAVKLIERMRQIGLSADVRVLFSQPTLAALAAAVGGGTEIVVPANLISEHCERIIPDMLPLVDLNQDAIDRIVARVPGGVANVQDIYALAPLQEGILYHHVMAPEDDPYRRTVLFNFDSQERVQQLAAALQAVIARHDILRTSVLWEDLDEPVQVVWRHAELSVEEIHLDSAQLQEALDPRHHHLDIRQAPMMRIAYAHDPVNDRWAALLVFHHLINDATSLPVLANEIEACMQGQEHLLPASVPYRNYVAQARLGVSIESHEAFFRDLLGDIDEPTLPFDLHDVQGDGSELEEVRQEVEAELAGSLRQQAQSLGVSAASLYHLVWAQVLGKVTGKDEVVFGTVLMGRMQGGDGADRSLGMFINTLPLRVELGSQGVRDGVKQTHDRLTALLGHEHASLVLAQRCSGVQAPTPLFSALLNYRHTDVTSSAAEGLGNWIDIERLKGTERTNYPLALNVDDQGQGFALTLTCPVDIGAERIAGYVHMALQSLVEALEHAPQAPLHSLSILPEQERHQLIV
ncbi:amino acid adenylation domain-containing protein, partial [Pseudomonas syringae]